jgi:hypothetical protein
MMNVLKRLAEDAEPKSLAVKAAHDFGFQALDFPGVVGVNHLLSQTPQFFAAQLTMLGKVEGVLDHFDLFIRRQIVHFLNHFGRCHAGKLRWATSADKFATAGISCALCPCRERSLGQHGRTRDGVAL